MAPGVDDLDGLAGRFGRQVVAEDATKEFVDHGVQPSVDESLALVFALPDLDVAQATFGSFDREVHHQPVGQFVADAGSDALVDGGVDGDVLDVCEHGDLFRSEMTSCEFNQTMWLRVNRLRCVGTTKRSTYDSSGRKASSEATRQRILDRAHASLLERGYRATKLADVARSADVHVATVYELVGRKPAILRELIERAISGADRPIPAEQRDYVAAMRAEPDPARKLTIYAAATTAIHARMAPLLLALRDAATTEPEAEAVWREISDRRAANMRLLATDLASAHGLRPGLTIDEVADFIWATNSAELYVLLTSERRWEPERYERWLVELWQRHLLAASTTT